MASYPLALLGFSVHILPHVEIRLKQGAVATAIPGVKTHGCHILRTKVT